MLDKLIVRPLIVLVCGVFLSVSLVAFADVEADIRLLLSPYHRQPEKQQWLALGQPAAEGMIKLYSSLSDNPSYRLKLLDGLQYFESASVTQFLEGVADGKDSWIFRAQAMESLMRMQPLKQRARCKNLLKDSSWKLRARILKQLVILGDKQAMAIVDEHLSSETSSAVKKQVARMKLRRR